MLDVPFASARVLAADALSALLPPARQTVAEYASTHRWLSNTGGGVVGRFRHDLVPYLAEPEECLTDPDYQTVAVAGPGQCGKTSIAENWALYSVDVDPADMLWYMQTEPALEAYVKGRINPMIDMHRDIRDKLGTRPVDDSIHFKRFRSMRMEFLSTTYSNLISKSAPRIVADEIDACPDSLGDIKAHLDVRRQTYGRHSKILAISHPDKARGVNPDKDWTAGIMAVYADSDRRVWYWPCPHCEAWSSPAPIAARVMTLDYPADGTLDEIEHNARLVCPVNGCVIQDHERQGMNVKGRWVGEGQEIAADGKVTGELVKRKTAGFWIVGIMSPFILNGIGGLARARVKAERERDVSGDDEALRQVMVKQWGVPYAPLRNVGSIDANDLADRAEKDLKLGVVPEGVRFLTASVDCQIAHFEYLVRGWGARGESWIIDKGRIPGDPATAPEDWDQLIAVVIGKSYPLTGNSDRRMSIRGVGFDSAGAPGVTQQAYTAWRRWRKSRTVRLYGKIAGYDVWNVTPLKGANGINAPKLSVSYPDTSRQANVKAGGGGVPVASFNPNNFKDDLAGQLQRAEPGDWYVHFPYELRSNEPPHVWFEQLTSEHRQKNGRWGKITPNARNESLDLMVMAHVIAQLHGLSRLDWEKPPSWAAPWDVNSLVSGPGASAAATEKNGSAAGDSAKKSLVDRLA